MCYNVIVRQIKQNKVFQEEKEYGGICTSSFSTNNGYVSVKRTEGIKESYKGRLGKWYTVKTVIQIAQGIA